MFPKSQDGDLFFAGKKEKICKMYKLKILSDYHTSCRFLHFSEMIKKIVRQSIDIAIRVSSHEILNITLLKFSRCKNIILGYERYKIVTRGCTSSSLTFNSVSSF